ncbi:protein of unknown function [Methanoculleus bourgensis]|uniref:site-specific DNA-methyltransferase (adenine-specific) n=1 Tax=Methanoculleus bourgensis TaxID=83986 RepID=A0A0X3BKP5_9EURY|nr:protein of unknown function [Methanoculleus bourgensis]
MYDPASASNGMLITAHKHVVENFGREEAKRLFLYGQEANAQTLAYGRMNMYIHDIRNVNLAGGDTLLYPKFKNEDGTGVQQFDVVIANPPWNQDGYEEKILKKGEFWKQRYPFGYTNRQSADWAWVQHMLASAKEDTGRVGVVIDNGCLFRGGKERAIRKKIIQEDLLECVILLPEKLFYNTGAPGAIMIFRKQKPEERRGKVLFINASDQFERHPDVRRLNILTDEDIATIAAAYEEFTNDNGFAHVVPVERIAQNDYSLNVTLYAFPVEEREDIDLAETWAEIRQLGEEMQVLDATIVGYLKEIGHTEFESDGNIRAKPKDWATKTIIEIFEVKTGSTPSTKVEEYWRDGTIKWYTPADLSYVNEKIYTEDSEKCITKKALNETNVNLVPKDTIIISTRAPVGTLGITKQEATFNQGCKGLVPRENPDVDSLFYYYYLLNNRKRLENRSSGSTFKELSKDMLESFPVPSPLISEKAQIATILTTIDRKLSLQRQQTAALKRLKQGLMNDLLTGKRRVVIG